MTDTEFIEETGKLEKYYGKELETFQLKIWKEELGHLSLTRYRQIIRQIFKISKFMPKLADIIEINSSLISEKKQTEETETVECSRCKGLGFITYAKLIDNGVIDEEKNITEKISYQYFARCDCANGNKYIYDGSKIQDSEHRSKYYVPSITELGLV